MATKKKTVKATPNTKKVPPPPVAPVSAKSDNVENVAQEATTPEVAEDTRPKTKVLYLSHTKPDRFQELLEQQVDHMERKGYELTSHSHCVADVGMTRAISSVGVYKVIYNLKEA